MSHVFFKRFSALRIQHELKSSLLFTVRNLFPLHLYSFWHPSSFHVYTVWIQYLSISVLNNAAAFDCTFLSPWHFCLWVYSFRLWSPSQYTASSLQGCHVSENSSVFLPSQTPTSASLLVYLPSSDCMKWRGEYQLWKTWFSVNNTLHLLTWSKFNFHSISEMVLRRSLWKLYSMWNYSGTVFFFFNPYSYLKRPTTAGIKWNTKRQ